MSPRHTKKHFQYSCYCCNLPLLYFDIHHYSVEGQDFRVQLDARQWLAEGLGDERSYGDFKFQVSVLKRDPLDK